MVKLTKRVIEALSAQPEQDVFIWDEEMRGFGLRVKPSGVKSFFIQYRNKEGRTRRLVLGRYGTLTPDQARDMAQQKLAAAARGEDPSAERHAARAGLTIAEICDWYLKEARAGRLLGRSRRPIKHSTLRMDRSRIETHIKPLLGSRPVRSLRLADIERMQADIVVGKTAKKRKVRGGHTTGGSGAAGRTVTTLRALLGHAARWHLIESNPAVGVRQVASGKRERRLSREELQRLGEAIREAAVEGEHSTGLAAIRLILLTGFRRMEALGLRQEWVRPGEHCVRFADTKSGPQERVIGRTVIDFLSSQQFGDASSYVFPADQGEGHFIGIVKVLDRVCRRAKLIEVTPHVLRHTFASIAGELGYSELTIKGLLGHAPRGVTQGYIHLDAALILAADHVSEEMSRLLGDAPEVRRHTEIDFEESRVQILM